MSLLTSLKQAGGGAGGKKKYQLNEILFVMSCIAEKKTKKEIAAITGRSEHSLQYKFYENEVNGKVRSIRKYESMQALYDDNGGNGAEATDQDVAERVEAWEPTPATTEEDAA